MDSATPNTHAWSARRRAALRIGGTAVAAAILLGLTPAVADATPRRPSDSEIAGAKAQADAVAQRIGALNAELADAEAVVDDARTQALIALDEFQATEAAAEAARAHAEAAAATAAATTAELGVARDDLVAFARRTYMEGSTSPGAAALLTAGSPAQLIERAALLEAAGSHRTDVLVRVTVLQEQATAADVVARAASVEADNLQQEAQQSLEVARTAEVSARAQQQELVIQQASVQAELVVAQQQLTTLVGERAAAERAASART
ncbi:coiled-coil domain-containing protein, partial [Candidatus Blastococcus massiliensis]|uniref:coiled-coil domain-containing protein n=1 Tax=Candidatus Blastococcus massiliensis TaxID=1470358 RepID=UPI0039C71E8B